MIRFHDDPPPAAGAVILKSSIPSERALRRSLIVRLIHKLIEDGHLAEEDRVRYEVCFEEAVVNAIVHGNGENPELKVSVSIHVDGDRWRVSITDQGGGFSEDRIRDTPTEDPLADGGRGIPLMHHYAGDLDYHDGGRTVVFTGVSAHAEGQRPPTPPAITPASRITEIEQTMVVRIFPESAGEPLPEQAHRIVQILEHRPPRLLVLDLTEISHLGSSGIGQLVRIYRKCETEGSGFALIGTSDPLREALELMHLDRVFSLCSSLEEARGIVA